MDEIDLQLLQRRVIELISRVTLLTQDIGTLRERLEVVAATVDLGLESLKAHADERFAAIDKRFTGLDEKLNLDRAANDAGFNTLLEAIAQLEKTR